jgi:hypothetical protein
MTRFTAVGVLGLTFAAACSSGQDVAIASGESDLHGISTSEALSELAAVGDAIRAYYGPLEFKERRFGFNLDAELAAAEQKIKVGTTEGDRVRPIYELLAKLHDGHVYYDYPLPGSATSENDLPMLITPYGNEYVVDHVKGNRDIAAGDIVVSIDDLPVNELARILTPLVGDGNPDSEKIWVADMMTHRSFYFPSALAPQGPRAHVVVKKPDGTQIETDLPWTTKAGGLPSVPTSVTPPAPGAVPSPYGQHLSRGTTLSRRVRQRRLRKSELATPEAGLESFGELKPFWMTAPVVAALGIHPVSPRTETLTAMGVTLPAAAPNAAPGTSPKFLALGAYKYVYEGKTVLVIRIPEFDVADDPTSREDFYGDNMAWLAALLRENLAPEAASPVPASPEDAPADVVVLDDTDNPGGSVDYALALASLFLTKPIPSMVQAMHADRKWLADYSYGVKKLAPWPDYAAVYEAWMHTIETAYDANQTLSDFIPLSGDYVGPGARQDIATILGANMLAPHPAVQWSKPVLILANDLSGSCGDFFPALLQNGGVAKTFGVRTMGLGGSVEDVLTQPFSRAVLSLTRGMGGPFNPNGPPKLIENSGVTPDIEHPVTLADFRAGFVDYATSFSHAAANLTRAR